MFTGSTNAFLACSQIISTCYIHGTLLNQQVVFSCAEKRKKGNRRARGDRPPISSWWTATAACAENNMIIVVRLITRRDIRDTTRHMGPAEQPVPLSLYYWLYQCHCHITICTLIHQMVGKPPLGADRLTHKQTYYLEALRPRVGVIKSVPDVGYVIF